jgi:hypothetical protein
MRHVQERRAPDILKLGSDLALRHRWFVSASFGHPAKLHLGLLCWLVETYTRPGDTIADCMSGIGSTLLAAVSGRNVIAREIEPRWLEIMQANAARIGEQAGLFVGHMDVGQADACQPWGYSADSILFSPPYGNEASSSGNARRTLPKMRGGVPITYRERWQYFQDHPTEGSVGAFNFHYGSHPAQIGHWRGERYWQAMQRIYTNARIALRDQGYLILVVKDHIHQGTRVQTADQTIALCESLGLVLHARHQRLVYPLSLWQRRRKEKGLPIVEEEDALVFRRKAGEEQAKSRHPAPSAYP